MNLSGKLNMNILSKLEQEQFTVIDICDDRYFNVLSASECLRFDI
jgi:hypothetical protein